MLGEVDGWTQESGHPAARNKLGETLTLADPSSVRQAGWCHRLFGDEMGIKGDGTHKALSGSWSPRGGCSFHIWTGLPLLVAGVRVWVQEPLLTAQAGLGGGGRTRYLRHRAGT